MLKMLHSTFNRMFYISNSKWLFSSNIEDISHSNARSLRLASMMSAILSGFYSLHAAFYLEWYLPLMLICLPFCLISSSIWVFLRLYRKKSDFPSRLIGMLCLLFIHLLLLFAMALGLLSFPGQVGYFFPVLSICAFALFIMPLWRVFLIQLAFYTLYLYLSFLSKPLFVFQIEVYLCATSLIMGFAVARNAFGLQLSEGRAKYHLRVMGLTDALTGLPNRYSLKNYMQTACNQPNCSGLWVYMVDIDDFKQYNDHFGHQAGDDCLRDVSQSLSFVARQHGALICRYGGEEFIVVLKGAGAAQAMDMAEQLRKVVEHRALENPKSPVGHITVSIGMDTCQHRVCPDWQQAINRADKAMYAAKSQGKNRVCLYKED